MLGRGIRSFAPAVCTVILVGSVSGASAQSPEAIAAGRLSAHAPTDPVLRMEQLANRLVTEGRHRRALAALRRALARSNDDRATTALHIVRFVAQHETLLNIPALDELTASVTQARDERLQEHPTPQERAMWHRVALEQALLTGLRTNLSGAVNRIEDLSTPFDPAAALVLERLAVRAVTTNDLETASRALTIARQHDPTRVALSTDQAAVELARGRASRAVGLLREAIRRRPDDPSLQRDLAGSLLAAGHAEEALSLFRSIAAHSDQSSAIHLDLGRAALEAGEYAAGQRAAEEALSLAPENLEALHLLGAAAVGAGRHAAARLAYRRILRARPEDPRARRMMETLQNVDR